MRFSRYPIRTILITAGAVVMILAIVIPNEQDDPGNAAYFSGTITKVIDGDTVEVDGQSIRFALSSTPEMYEDAGVLARDFVERTCPVGSPALVNEDDGQTDGSYGRIIALVKCQGIILNEVVLDSGHAVLSTEFCAVSEFADTDWAQRHGC